MIARAISKPPFVRNDIVYQKCANGFRYGIIVEPGMEQSGVLWNDMPKVLIYDLNKWMTAYRPGQHQWVKRFHLECCYHCGLIRRHDDKNKPCKGPVLVSVRKSDHKPLKGSFL